MVSATKFIRGLEGNMRLRVNNKPIPDYAKGFKNPVPKPPNGGNGYIIPVVKFIAKGFKYAPLMLLYDLVFPKPVSDGTLPAWVKDVGDKQTIESAVLPFTGGQLSGVSYKLTVNLDIRFQFTTARVNRDYGVIDQPGIPGKITQATYTGEGTQSLRITVLFSNGTVSTSQLVNTGSGNYIYPGSVKLIFQRVDNLPDGENPPPTKVAIITNSDFDAKNNFDRYTPEEWKSKFLADFWGEQDRLNKQRKISTIPEPKIFLKPAVIPTEIPQPIPDYDPDQEPDLDIFPDPEPVFVPTPRPKIIPEPIINPDPQPDVNPAPDKTPKPEPKWTKITKYIPEPKEPIVVITKPSIVLDKTPKPLPDPQPVKPPPPIQTPIDKCVDHCGGGTIDFELPDDSELAELLKAIKKKVDEIEQSVNQTLEGEIEVGSCEIPKDKNNETDELIYEPDPAKKITYSDKGLKAINLALSGVQTKLTSLHEEFCQPKDIPPSIPEWWQVRAGSDRPQLVVIFKGGNSYWSMAIPWYKGKFKEKIIDLIPGYNRGNFSTILTLNDNSKIVVNASSKEEGKRFIKRIEAVVKPSLLEQAELKAGGERKGKPLKTGKVIPVYAKYFATGQQNLLPDWRYNFKTQKFIKYAKPDT